jgi:hypothetical protein
MNGIALWRVNLLRAGYLLLVVGLGLVVWPSVLDPAQHWETAHGVIAAMLSALSLLALLGLRHPLRMLPILLWEIGWKLFWLLRIALPLWLGGQLDPAAMETVIECAVVVLIVAVVPWDYVVRTYVRAAGEPWKSGK